MSETNGHAVDADGDPLFPDEVPIPRYPAETATIEARSPAGYKVTWTIYDPIPGAVSARLAAVEKQGYTPATDAPAGRGATEAAQAQPNTADPVCPYHGPMKESTIKGKEGTFYCPKKMADDSYCKERWPK